jgi:hypothetical protein
LATAEPVFLGDPRRRADAPDRFRHGLFGVLSRGSDLPCGSSDPRCAWMRISLWSLQRGRLGSHSIGRFARHDAHLLTWCRPPYPRRRRRRI